jgi:catechol 2,3-dioxygenase-like lactoylglutathione lyase family enzyme
VGPLIAGAHVVVFAEDAEAARAFFRDVLEWPNVDAHGGWLIFALPAAELGVHPVEGEERAGRHELWLMCHDIERTRAELEAKGVELTAPVRDEGFGRTTSFVVPGLGETWLYEPHHPSPLAEFS